MTKDDNDDNVNIEGMVKSSSTSTTSRRRILQIVIVGLVILANLGWIVDTIFLHDNWECVSCRQGKNSNRLLQFIYYSIWGLWMNSFVILGWVKYSNDGGNNKSNDDKGYQLVRSIFQVAFPYAIAVMLGYIYYSISNPPTGFIDEDFCYRMGRSGVSKALFSENNEQLATIYLILMTIWDITMHYITPLFMLYLHLSKEIEFQPSWVPWSGILVFILSIIIVLAQTYGDVVVYCEGLWFSVIVSTITTTVINYVLSLMTYRKMFDRFGPADVISSSSERESDDASISQGDVEEGNTES